MKTAETNAQEILNELVSMPDACHTCGTAFDSKSDFCLDNWIVNVSDSEIRMFCDMCKAEE